MEKERGVLDVILAALEEVKKSSFFSHNTKEIFLEAPYTIIELENGDQGIAANYDYIDQRKDDAVMEKIRENEILAKELLEKSRHDVLLYHTILVNDFKDNLTLQSVRVAILSALSRGTESYLQSRGVKIKGDLSFHLDSLAVPDDSITFIGFGGNVLKALNSDKYRDIYVSDYKYTPRKLKMAKFMKTAYPDKNLTFVDPTHNNYILENSNVAWVTASSMSNGTVDSLIDGAVKCREVIFQGATGAIFPMPLFERSVTRVVCPNINFDFLSCAKQFREGKETDEYFKKFPKFVDRTIKNMYLHL
jgi:uncharacterized protein (DUF4213/DUF364 family)